MGTRAVNPNPGYVTLNAADLLKSIRQNSTTKLRAVRISLVLADFVLIVLSFTLAFSLRFTGPTSTLFDPTQAETIGTPGQLYASFVYILIPLWLLLFATFRLYDPSILFGGHQEYTNIFNACTIGIMIVIFTSFLVPTIIVARGWLFAAWAFTIFFIVLERFTVRRVVYALRRRGHFMSPTYIVGANEEGIAIAEQIISAPTAGVNVIGFLDDNIHPGEEVLPGVVVHGPTSKAESLVDRFGIERLIVATSGVQRDNLLDLFRRYVNSEAVSVWLSSGMYEILTTGVKVQDVGSVPMVSVNRVRLNGINVFLKAMLDYIGATVGLIALSPMFLAIAIIMRRTDPGPIIYRRRVVGVGGKEFDAFKFRTMVVNSDEVLREVLERDPEAKAEWDQFRKLKNDPRITKIGAFLRKTSVDEFPQLLNVLRGEMSLVGPRMITLEELEKYGRWGLNLHTVKPGITGLWQVTGRSELTYEERVRLDMRYIRNYSIWLDLQIVFQTIPAVLLSKGAY
jgi:exopolysaccharide biosynthesis polyprenyl glycosylphosphotransferase